MSVPPDRPHARPALQRLTRLAGPGAVALGLLGGCGLLQPEAGRRDPAVEHLRSDDDLARIEATRVRGQTGAVTVTPHAASAPAYQVLPPGTGDASQRRGAEGQRVWPVLQF